MAERPRASQLCFACGSENPHGFRLRFELQDGRATTTFVAPEHLQGFPGRMHGGGVATILDEAMGWAAYANGAWAATARLTTRFRQPVPLGEPLDIAAWQTRDRGRVIEMRSELRARDGTLLADAEGMFARVRGKQAEELSRLYGQAPT